MNKTTMRFLFENYAIDLAAIPGVEKIFVYSNNGTSISVHLSCEDGKEKSVFDQLPKWLHDNFSVVSSLKQVFIRSKNENLDLKAKHIASYNEAINDILTLISTKKIDGIQMVNPPEVLYYTFEKLKLK